MSVVSLIKSVYCLYHTDKSIFICPGGHLEESLIQYNRSKEFGVERAAMHIRNVCILLHLMTCHDLLHFRLYGPFTTSGEC